jgi:hypothetical protein
MVIRLGWTKSCTATSPSAQHWPLASHVNSLSSAQLLRGMAPESILLKTVIAHEDGESGGWIASWRIG